MRKKMFWRRKNDITEYGKPEGLGESMIKDSADTKSCKESTGRSTVSIMSQPRLLLSECHHNSKWNKREIMGVFTSAGGDKPGDAFTRAISMVIPRTLATSQ